MPPVGFTFLRYGLASIALLAILRWSEGEIRLPRPARGRILLLGGARLRAVPDAVDGRSPDHPGR